MSRLSRWLRTRTAFAVLVAGWVVVLLSASLGAWDGARSIIVVLVVVFGVVSVFAFMQRWGETQDSVVERDSYRARLADEVEKILDNEDKEDKNDGRAKE